MLKWLFTFAWRDSRGSRAKLFLFVTSMVLGVAALVSINSFGDNLRRAIDFESKTLLGADLSMESGEPFPATIEAIIDSLGGIQSRRTSFSSMAYFPKSNTARLATVRGQEPGFPFYGKIESDPPEAADTYLFEKGALIDGTLMAQYDIEIGDSVRIGNATYTVSGKLIQTPRETAAIMLFSPRIYVPLADVDTTLLSIGSRAEYEIYFRLDDIEDPDAIVESLSDTLEAHSIRADTVEEERSNWDQSLTNLYRFLGLVGYMSLLLGSLGVASSIHVYIRQRIQTIAVLRVYGASSHQAFAIYLIQALGMGLVGAFLGSAIGIGLQSMLPVILGDFLPVDVEFSVSWSAVLIGSAMGIGVTLIFAMMPLLDIRNIPPLAALRTDFDQENDRAKNKRAKWLLFGLMALLVTVIAVIQAPTLTMGLGYSATVAVVFALLAGTAKLVMRFLAAKPPSGVSFVIKQGLANLHRPQNQTLMMVLALGFGTFLVSTMIISESTLLGQIDLASTEGKPNLVFYDVQPAQVDSLVKLVEESDLPVIDRVAMISMRLTSVKGISIESMREDTTSELSWAHRREYRSTYRDYLTESETVLEGTFEGRYSGTGLIPLSVEREVAKQLEITIGDSLVFNIQGVDVAGYISSIREVNWRQMQSNFFFVFPEGSINDAPAFHVVMSRTETPEASAMIQAMVVKRYPNISSIDISVVLTVFQAIFSRISFVVRFMALFSIITGLLVLSGAVMISRFQRIEESVLLKTLGASRRTVLQIMTTEYFVLGVASSFTGVLLSLAAGWGVSRFVFEANFIIPFGPILLLIASVIGVTIVVGQLNSRGVYDKEALDVLRKET
ncbi:MAG: ABC transporter permease [Bacteroidetes bacterium]|nr:ABC transporter permease [Bacteroidota bacterium]